MGKGADTMSESMELELQQIKQEIQDLKAQLAGTTASGEDDLKELGGRLIDRLEQTLRSSLERIKEPVEKAGDFSKEVLQTGQQKIEEQPLLGILAAFGLGMLVARLWERKS